MDSHLPEPTGAVSGTDGTPSVASVPAGPPRFTVAITPRTLWVTFGILLVMIALLLLVTKSLGALLLIFLSITLAEAIRPPVARLQRYHIPQPLAVLLVYLVSAAVLAGLLWVLFTPVLSEESEFAVQLPADVTRLQSWFAELRHTLSAYPAAVNAAKQVSATLATWASYLLSFLIGVPAAVLTGIIGVIIDVAIVLTMALFWLAGSARFKRFLVGLFAPNKRPLVSGVIAKMSRTLGGWVVGSLISMFLIGTLTTIGLSLVGAPYALLLGIVAGLTEFIPYLGPWISGTLAALVTLITTRDPITVIWVIVVFLFIQELEGNVIEPLVMHQAVKLDPWLVLVAILIGGDLLGLVGIILAVPIAALIQVVVLEVVAPAIRLATTSRGEVSPSGD